MKSKVLFTVLVGLVIGIVIVPVAKALSPQSQPVRLVYSTTNLTATSYVELVHSSVKGLSGITVVNSGLNPVNIAFGAAGSESNQIVVYPQISATAAVFYPVGAGYGTRVSAEAIGGTNSAGELELNLIFN